MGTPSKKPIIGLLGGIASGKSTVAAEFAKLGCGVIDADKLAHDVLDEQDVRSRVVSLFGPQVAAPDGGIVRARLAESVFADEKKLALLNELLHPRVLERTEQLMEQFRADSSVRAIVLDMPLLAEVGWAQRCDCLVFVDCERARRLDRMAAAGWGAEGQLETREKFQISLDSKKRLADNVIDNNSGLSALVGQVADIFSRVTG